MKNSYHFMLKALFVPDYFYDIGKRLDTKANFKSRKLISKLITSQAGKQIITIPILRNISRSKGNQIMKFGKLIEYNKRN